ncbi:MAG TPA: hypothetical protein VGL04_10855 [Sporichthyaceae bacterium]|jgi:hypothetical protein
MKRPNPRRTGTALGVLLVGAAGWIVLPASNARADASYAAVARTETFTQTINNPSIPTGIDIEGGGPQAEVRQTSLDVRDASAQLPYAGDTVPGLPGLGGSLFNFPVPAYPFIAATSAGSPPQNVSYPGVVLHAESGDYLTRASSTFGQPGSGATSAANITEDRDGSVTAVANTFADTVALGPYVTLSDVRSVVTVASSAAGKLTRTSSSSIGRISVPGLSFEMPKTSPAQIPVPVPIPGVPNQPPIPVPQYPYPAGGETFHDPDIGIQDGYFTLTQVMGGQKQTYLIPSDSALAAFKAAGVTIRFQSPQQTADGLISGAYIVEYTFAAPPQNGYYNGATKLTQTTAYSIANVDLTPEPASAGVVGAPGGGPPPLSGVTPNAPLAPVPAGVPATDAAVPTADGPAELPIRGLLVAEPAVSVAGIKVGHGLDGPYLALAGLGLLGGLLVVGVRVLGGR